MPTKTSHGPARFTARLGDLPLNQVDGGVLWVVQDIEGLYDTQFSIETGAYAYQDGGWISNSWVRPKHLVLKIGLRVTSPTLVGVEGALQTLHAYLPYRAAVPLIVKTPAGSKSCPVRCEDQIKTKIHAKGATITIPLICSEPFFYATDWETGKYVWEEKTTGPPSRRGGLTFPGRARFLFDATETSGVIRFTSTNPPGSKTLIQISGPAKQITVQDEAAGWLFQYRAEIPTGSILTVDPQIHTVTLDGTPRRRQFSGNWPHINPGLHDINWQAQGRGARLIVKTLKAA